MGDDDDREVGGRNTTDGEWRELSLREDNKKEKKEVNRKVRGEKEEVERRTRRGEMNKRRGDWAGKRGEMREQRRREEEQADWIFQRSVHHTLKKFYFKKLLRNCNF